MTYTVTELTKTRVSDQVSWENALIKTGGYNSSGWIIWLGQGELLHTFGWWYLALLPRCRAYLSRLESGWEEAPWLPLLPLPPVPENPLPVPADWRFPERSFSTAARFPVRAASRSSCSFPISNPKEFGEDAGERRKQGRSTAWVKFLSYPPFIIPTTASYFSQLPERKQKPPLPADGPVYTDPRYRWRKSFVAARYQHRANFLWPVPRASSVTSLKLPFSSTYKSTPAPPPKLLYKKVDGYKQYGAPA